MILKNLTKIFTNRQHFQVFILGIYGGMPLTIIFSTLSAWMKGENIDIAIITSFALARIFYSLKVFWAPFIEQINLPFSQKIGHRKSWMLLFFCIISAIMLIYSKSEPKNSLNMMYFLTLFLGFSAATVEIVMDAFRIETIKKEEQAIAATNLVIGYSLGGILAGAGILYLAQDYGWPLAFSGTAILYLLGCIFVLTLTEPNREKQDFNIFLLKSWQMIMLEPLQDFLKRDKALVILATIMLYKLGDSFINVISYSFYLELGFSLKEISAIVRIFGLAGILFGSILGGVVAQRYSHLQALMIGSLAQGVTNLTFISLHHLGHNPSMLTFAIVAENIGMGMSSAALISYVSYLCNKKFSATQYALFVSSAGLLGNSLVIFGGAIEKIIGWDKYFIMTFLMTIPSLLLAFYLHLRYRAKKI